MISFTRLSRMASVAFVAGSVLFGAASAQAQEVSAEHLQASRSAIAALGVTDRFDAILPSIMDQLTVQLIQAYPNLEDKISDTVNEQALKLAARRADLENEAALVYARAFTAEELQAITAFYSSEAGKKLLKDGPIATRELLKAADIWTAGIARDLEQQSNEALLSQVQPEAAAGGTQP
ncbi:DUF2059 domain-containing protein [Peteryoungia desertarenae]|uniref:DUF2059 domain-containing protein n=1 Tax=Peteryoungia desertarenae TaxID=1813451 RepID=A0ABX6QQ92_9HYPH|nr:DUF2059 domain-containing protein [Peteryoungia desertarenae]QLF70728.1 DUF2059 domain-containing protein [Peteryoungia desertarenae]